MSVGLPSSLQSSIATQCWSWSWNTECWTTSRPWTISLFPRCCLSTTWWNFIELKYWKLPVNSAKASVVNLEWFFTIWKFITKPSCAWASFKPYKRHKNTNKYGLLVKFNMAELRRVALNISCYREEHKFVTGIGKKIVFIGPMLPLCYYAVQFCFQSVFVIKLSLFTLWTLDYFLSLFKQAFRPVESFNKMKIVQKYFHE